ncbi:N-methyltryptophan oxidase [Yersinia pseudotuberculosis]|uniref:N-methyl-L-tryptophan oxidase n=1 Tax=Yersinia pseudotuberculosis TaxID=633 RepID=UPI00034983ED|nr:N-methyl-L-tryptophan oxidase [Yersinia pseudotuberculosis]MBO1548646.1 N-methyl-L-tryptophan oxidase [Yersinia pseudotuberculosis]MBO1569075.1 N-methyl-L-tryptophan oxidase [Yersinia pseudotuberculosis]MBO1583806.1 N-methyl-L-tryptophan oxidase [Yersinia pseudotuberculosis]MBO1633565.1 N-methyl-L-tryptophan oxidase [Yersinia pseudotuberculosis]QES98726.1 N-methyl-L-tryptophan oxidase [Yersinia pseudotuberculosis]
MDYDLIVIGSGSVGSAAGYYASQAGLNVLMIDSAMPPHQAGSHHGETRIMRHAYGEGEKYVPLVLRAQALWDQLAAQTGEKLFQACGVINLGPDNSTFLQNVQRSAQQYDLPVETLNSTQIREKWPVFTVPDNYIAVFEPQSGYLRSELAVKTLIKAVTEAGCGILFNCPVTAIESHQAGVDVVTIDGTYSATKVVVTAGTWVKELLPTLPVTPVRKVFSWHQADGRYSEANHFPAFTVEMPDNILYYGFPAQNDALKLGKHHGGQLIESAAQRKPFGRYAEDGTEVFSFLRHFLPGVGVCLRGEACSYDMSPDEDFIIDTLPEDERIMVVSGLSGHGFKFATALGEVAALFAQDKPSPIDISAFSLARFR